MLTLRHPIDLDPDAVERIAWQGVKVRLHDDLLDELNRARTAMLDALPGRRVYGVNTGTGFQAGTDLSPSEQHERQRSLLLGRAVGSAPYLTYGEARAVWTARLASLLSGHAGVSTELCVWLVDRLNDGVAPAIPRRSIGCAGEIIPLSHAFQTILGVGVVVRPDGSTQPAAEALTELGVEPFEPGEKEGIALLAGSPAAAACGLARRRDALLLANQLSWSAACAIDALRAPLDVYEAEHAELGGDKVLARVLALLRIRLTGSEPARQPLQAPVSFRVAPQVLTHLERTIARLGEDVGRTLGAISDSPAFVGGRFLASGGFHAIEVAASLDALAAALVRCAELAGQRVHRLLDSRFTGLPDQLVASAGGQAGMVVVQKRVAGALNELRRRAFPASVGLTDTSLGQEDAMTFVFEASENVREISSLLRDVVASELLVSRQAWALRGERRATGLGRLAERLIETVAPLDSDRPLGVDLDRVRLLLADETLFPAS